MQIPDTPVLLPQVLYASDTDLVSVIRVDTLEAQAEGGLPQLITEATSNERLTQATLCEGPPQRSGAGAQHEVVQEAPGQFCL